MRLCIEDAEAVISCPWMLGNARFGALWGSGTLCVVHGERETFCAAALDGEPDVSLNTSDEMMSQTGNRQE